MSRLTPVTSSECGGLGEAQLAQRADAVGVAVENVNAPHARPPPARGARRSPRPRAACRLAVAVSSATAMRLLVGARAARRCELALEHRDPRLRGVVRARRALGDALAQRASGASQCAITQAAPARPASARKRVRCRASQECRIARSRDSLPRGRLGERGQARVGPLRGRGVVDPGARAEAVFACRREAVQALALHVGAQAHRAHALEQALRERWSCRTRTGRASARAARRGSARQSARPARGSACESSRGAAQAAQSWRAPSRGRRGRSAARATPS